MPQPVHTFSICAGGTGCDARCPFCISKQTGLTAKCGRNSAINFRNLSKAWRMSRNGDTTTVLITGEGEPMLYAPEVEGYLKWFHSLYGTMHSGVCGDCLAPMPLIELQTNGLRIGDVANLANDPEPYPMPKWLRKLAEEYWQDHPDSQFHPYVAPMTDRLKAWHDMGLDTIAISAVGTDWGPASLNAKVYRENYPCLESTVRYLRSLNYTVRLCIMMMRGGVDSWDRLRETAEWCKENDVTQLTARPLKSMENADSEEARAFAAEHGLNVTEVQAITEQVTAHAKPVLDFPFGATLYNLNGQNLTMTNCMTPNSQEIRTLIFYGNGDLVPAWDAKGCKLLAGWPDSR